MSCYESVSRSHCALIVVAVIQDYRIVLLEKLNPIQVCDDSNTLVWPVVRILEGLVSLMSKKFGIASEMLFVNNLDEGLVLLK